MAMTGTRKLLIAAAALAAAGFGVTTPAAAGKYGHGYYGHGYHGGYYGRGYYGRGYRHGYRRGYHHHRRKGGGGKAAAIALGVIGGAIILNELAESKAERRAYEDRYYDRRYDRYSTRAAPSYDRGAFERGYREGLEAGRATAAPRDLRDGDFDDDLEDRLDGAGGEGFQDNVFRNDGGPEPIRFSAAEAYQACMTHARAALSERGYILAGPHVPDTAEDVGGAWKMTANVSAQNRTGDSWNRAMYCEADASRVYLLELI